MIAVIEKITEGLVDLVIEESEFWFQIPIEFIPKNRGIKEGSRIQFNLIEIPRTSNKRDDLLEGGFIKNPPKRELI